MYVTDSNKRLPILEVVLITGAYFGLSFARYSGQVPDSWSLMPVVETAWLNFLIVLAIIFWLRTRKIPLAKVGLAPFKPTRSLLMWVLVVMAIDTLAIGLATPSLTSIFGEAPEVERFDDLPGNFPLLLILLPFTWLIGAFGEEFFFRGFLLTAIAGVLGGTRAAWIAAVVLQAIAFGLVHAYQGPTQAISIGIGGAVYGAAFLLAGKNLWPVILAHGVNDTLGFIFLYTGVIQR